MPNVGRLAMTPSEIKVLTKFAHGEIRVLECDSWNDVRNIRVWMAENYPYIRLRPRLDEDRGKVMLKAAVRRSEHRR